MNHYINEEDARSYFFVETSNDYIEQEITWIQTLVPLSYKIWMQWQYLGIIANGSILNVRYANISALTFAQFFMSIIYKSLVLKFLQK